MKEFIEYLIKHIVDKPGEVQVNEITGQRTVVFEVRVGEGDMGKVIGRRGQNAKSLRILLGAAAAKQGKRSVLEILNLNGMEQKNSQYENPEREVTVRKPGSESHSNDEKRRQDNGRNNLS
jgi:predicted RNA-binding protein YlqC (UPF0109 family)